MPIGVCGIVLSEPAVGPPARGASASLTLELAEELFSRAAACDRCPRMEGRRRVLGPLNGRIPAEVMFVGEAPGRLGAEVTGAPFKGDRAGRNFERLLEGVGLDRDSVFITNAVICNPRSSAGANSRPTAPEIRNCSTWLERTMLLVDPKLVVSLGVVALGSLAALEAHHLTLSRDVGGIVRWFDRMLLPLYHPGGRAMARRPFSRQQQDWSAVSAALSGIGDNGETLARLRA